MNDEPKDSARLDAAITRALRHDPAAGRDATEAAARVIARLAARPLPPQQRPERWWHWPVVLLDIDLAPSWPRIAALAGVAGLGVMIGLAGPDIGIFDSTGALAAPVSEVNLIVLDNADGIMP